jgi:hypothetical protein
VEQTLTAMEALEKANFFTIEGSTVYWKKDTPLLIKSERTDNVLVVAPRVEE